MQERPVQKPCPSCKRVIPVKSLVELPPVVTTWFKHWSFVCGHCEREVSGFSIWPYVRCPWCRVVNHVRRLYASGPGI